MAPWGVATALLAAGLVFPVHDAMALPPNSIENPSFETGDLAGWEVVEGTAFSGSTWRSSTTPPVVSGT